MIGWVDAICKEWGRAQYWLLFGKTGWPTRTVLGKLMEEGIVGAACSQFLVEYPEVLTGDNLRTANAIKLLPEEPRSLVTIHYVIRMPAKQKCQRIPLPLRTYYAKLGDAHVRLANVIQFQENCELRKRLAQNSIQTCNTNQVAGSTI